MASQLGGSGARPKIPRQSPGSMQQASTLNKEGWLCVQKKSFFGLVKEQEMRYCAVVGDTMLVVYEDDTKSVIKTVCHLTHARDVTATDPCRFVFKISMRGDEPSLVLVSHDKEDMMDWIYSLNVVINTLRAARRASSWSQGRGTHQAENKTDPGTCLQPSMSHSEREFLNDWFPNLDTAVYIVPPEHVDTVHITKQFTRGGDQIDVLKTQQEIDSDSTKFRTVSDVVHIDRTLKKVHYCMKKIKKKALSQREVMVIMTQAKCGVYGFGSESLYTGAAARNMNTDKAEPDLEDLVLEEDFVDLLVISRQKGILMGAVIPQTEEDPPALQEALRKTTEYLKQARCIIRHCVLGDLATQPGVYQTILMPNTTRQCLEEALRDMKDLQELEVSLGVGPGQGVGRYCLCTDDMADDRRLHAWWSTCLIGIERGDPNMNDAAYATMVARFSVPLTTVHVYLNQEPRLQLWTQGHFVQAVGEEHGRPMSRLALFRQQFEILEEVPPDNTDDIAILIGGPGVGKSCILVVRGAYWVKKGCRTVFVVKTSNDGTSAAYLVRHRLKETVGQGADSVQLINMAGEWDKEGKRWTEEGQKKLDALCQHANTYTRGNIHILADEVDGEVMAEIYTWLKQRHITVSLWAAGVKVKVPDDMVGYVRHLTQPLRSPPSVVREVERSNDMKQGKVPAYTAPPVAPPSDGPPVITVGHVYSSQGKDQGHASGGPWRCKKCAVMVADILTSLHVGCHDHAPHGQGGLAFSDVFALGSDPMNCHSSIKDADDKSPAPFIRGLESRGVPALKVANGNTAAVRELAEMSSAPRGEERAADGERAVGRGRDEAVTVANEDTVWGLERHIVVYLDYDDGAKHGDDGVMYGVQAAAGAFGASGPLGGFHVNDADTSGRLRSMSRSTAQVIWVKDVLR